jgi:hypothetical protein
MVILLTIGCNDIEKSLMVIWWIKADFPNWNADKFKCTSLK